LEQRDRALAEQERQLCAQAERHEELAGLAIGIQDFCKRVKTGLMNASFEQKRKLVELLIDRVVVTDHNVEIRYVIPTAPRSEHIRFCHLRTDYFAGPKASLSAALPNAHFILKPDIDLLQAHTAGKCRFYVLEKFF
jgi:site-specific DNA recombinase